MKLLADLFPVILFFGAYQLYDIYAATAVAIVASIVQVCYHWLTKKRVEKTHLATLAILLIFGGLTLILHDRTFIMWKPSVINWLFGIVLLGSQFIGKQPILQRLINDFFVAQSQLLELSGQQQIDFGNCSGLFSGNQLEMCNTAHSLEQGWVNFKLFGMMGLTLVFGLLQAFYLARHLPASEATQEEN
ncbi:MAG: septation protein IspZ [Candidatus Thiodiazotropha sp.]